MTFPFLEELEKIIVEHGSAIVTKERLELAKEKYSALEVLHEQKIFKCTSKIEDLESDKISLQSNCQNLLRENEAYKNDLSQSEEKIRNLEKELNKFKHNDDPYKMKWGCLVFDNDEKLYCPKCYFDKKRKIPTSRANSSNRFCAVCNLEIPS